MPAGMKPSAQLETAPSSRCTKPETQAEVAWRAPRLVSALGGGANFTYLLARRGAPGRPKAYARPPGCKGASRSLTGKPGGPMRSSHRGQTGHISS